MEDVKFVKMQCVFVQIFSWKGKNRTFGDSKFINTFENWSGLLNSKSNFEKKIENLTLFVTAIYPIFTCGIFSQSCGNKKTLVFVLLFLTKSCDFKIKCKRMRRRMKLSIYVILASIFSSFSWPLSIDCKCRSILILSWKFKTQKLPQFL